MFAESPLLFTSETWSLILLGLFLALGAWNVWLNTRLKRARSFENELRAVVGLRLDERFRADDPGLGTALLNALQARLPDIVNQQVSTPSSRVQAVLAERLAQQVERSDPQFDALLGDRLQNRVQEIFVAPGDHGGWFEAIDDKLCERIDARAADPGADCARAMAEKIDVALQGRLEAIFDEPDNYSSWFEEIDGKLCEAILTRIDHLDDAQMDTFVAEQVFARVQTMFENPDDHEGLFEAVDEKLTDRILKQIAKLPDETATRMDAVIRDALVQEVEHIFDDPETYEDTLTTIDEQLGQRISRMLNHPTPELQEMLEGPIREGLASRLGLIFDNPDDYEALLEQVDEQLGKRIERRLREELARGAEGLIEQLVVEQVRDKVRARVEGRRESLDLAIDNRIARHNGEGKE